jgi:hypothetical protein
MRNGLPSRHFVVLYELVYESITLAPCAIYPSRILVIHNNGTIPTKRTLYTVERISIRRVKPFIQ